jgi:hypothetical protein
MHWSHSSLKCAACHVLCTARNELKEDWENFLWSRLSGALCIEEPKKNERKSSSTRIISAKKESRLAAKEFGERTIWAFGKRRSLGGVGRVGSLSFSHPRSTTQSANARAAGGSKRREREKKRRVRLCSKFEFYRALYFYWESCAARVNYFEDWVRCKIWSVRANGANGFRSARIFGYFIFLHPLPRILRAVSSLIMRQSKNHRKQAWALSARYFGHSTLGCKN